MPGKEWKFKGGSKADGQAEKIFSYRDVPCVWDFEAKEMSYIIPDILPEAAISLFTGDSGTGKSVLATAMAGAIITGGLFLDRQAVQRKVLYLDREQPVALVKKHLFDLHIARNPDLIIWGGWCEQEATGPASVELLEFARAEKPVMIFDPLIAFHTGDEQDATETRRYLAYYRVLTNAGATIALLHHTGKSETAKHYRGSTDIKASVDMAWLLERLGDNPAGPLKDLRLVPFKNKMGGSEPIPISFRDGAFVPSGERPPTQREILERILRTNPNSTARKVRELGMAAGLPKYRIEQLLVEGVQNGWIQVQSGARRSKHYSLVVPDVEI